MSKNVEKFVIYGHRETYHELGTYDLKVVLNSKLFKNSHLSEITICDSDGVSMKTEVKKWGRKMNCSFVIDDMVSDGVATIRMLLSPDRGSQITENVFFWIIKP